MSLNLIYELKYAASYIQHSLYLSFSVFVNFCKSCKQLFYNNFSVIVNLMSVYNLKEEKLVPKKSEEKSNQ